MQIADETGLGADTTVVLGGTTSGVVADALTLNGGTLQTTATFTINDAHHGITLGTNGGTFLTNTGTTVTVSNPITGGGGLTKAGNGMLVLGVNTYQGKMIVNGGAVQIADENSLCANPAAATADALTLDGGTLQTNTTFTINDANRGSTLGAGGGTF